MKQFSFHWFLPFYNWLWPSSITAFCTIESCNSASLLRQIVAVQACGAVKCCGDLAGDKRRQLVGRGRGAAAQNPQRSKELSFHSKTTKEKQTGACCAECKNILVQGKFNVMLCVAGVCLCICRNPRLDLCWIPWSFVTDSRLLMRPCWVRMLQKTLYQVQWPFLKICFHNCRWKRCRSVLKKRVLLCSFYMLTFCIAWCHKRLWIFEIIKQ